MKKLKPFGPAYENIRYFVRHDYTGGQNPAYIVGEGSLATTYRYSTFTSVKTPNYRFLKKIRKLPVNRHEAYSETARAVPTTRIAYRTSPYKSIYYGYSYLNVNHNNLPWYSDSDFSDLNTIVRLQVKDSSFNASIALGELSQTARFLDNRVGNTVRFLSNVVTRKKGLKRNRPPYVKTKGSKPEDPAVWVKNPYYSKRQHDGFAKTLSSSWLEYAYAFRPLMADLDGAAKVLATFPDRSAGWSVKRTLKRSKDSGITGQPWTYSGHCEASKTIALWCYTSNPIARNFASLGLTNPLSLAWELTPYSFVFDWIYPFGKFVDSIDAGIGVEVVSGYSVLKVESSGVADYLRNDDVEQSTAQCFMNRKYYLRVSTGLPPITLPKLKAPNGFYQAASGLALITQLFTRK